MIVEKRKMFLIYCPSLCTCGTAPVPIIASGTDKRGAPSTWEVGQLFDLLPFNLGLLSGFELILNCKGATSAGKAMDVLGKGTEP